MSKQSDFINAIAPLAQAEYTNRSRWVLPSVCIAQGALESGWNIKAKTLFGIKGNGNSLKTVEYINGRYQNVTANFKAFPNIASAVHGYYDLICNTARYSGAVNNPNYISAIRAIKNGGYATDPNYANKIINIIQSYGLTRYDVRLSSQTATPKVSKTHKKATKTVANKVIRGEYGNGAERKRKLESEGYDYNEVQKLVNQILRG